MTRDDYFMVEYYLTHPEDFFNPQHNLKGVNILRYIKRPQVNIEACGACSSKRRKSKRNKQKEGGEKTHA